MKYVFLDCSSGISGDMILGSLLDLGVSPSFFKEKMATLTLPVEIEIKDTKRASLKGIKVDVLVREKTNETRKWSDIEMVIEKSQFSSSVKKNALNIFRNLFEAESRVHDCDFHKVHLHEAGADDALIDIIGCCFLSEVLKIHEFYASPLNLGSGWVKSAHGILPVPAPAVGELLKNIPVYSAWAEEELVTPTGAAIVSTLVKEFIPFPQITYEKIGYGAGSRNFPEFPNILRSFYGECRQFEVYKRIYLIETNIDDSSPQILASLFDKILKMGALDVFLTPVLMKKNRLATKLTILTEIDKMDNLIETIFKETSSTGIRYFPVERRVLERTTKNVRVLGEEIRVKIAFLGGKEVNIQPEFNDCLNLAKKKNIPLKKIFDLTMNEFYKKQDEYVKNTTKNK